MIILIKTFDIGEMISLLHIFNFMSVHKFGKTLYNIDSRVQELTRENIHLHEFLNLAMTYSYKTQNMVEKIYISCVSLI